MKLLFLSDHGFNIGGGAEKYSQILSESLKKIGLSLITASIECNGSQVKLSTGDDLKSKVYDKKLVTGLRALKKELGVDAVHANILEQPHALTFVKACSKLELPFVSTLHSYANICPTEYFLKLPSLSLCNNPYPNLHCIKCSYVKSKMESNSHLKNLFLSPIQMLYNMFVFKRYMRNSKFVIAPSKLYSKFLEKKGINSLHKYHPVNYNDFKPKTEGDGSILFIGRLKWQKGVTILPELARRLPSTKFHVVGTGDMYSWLAENSPENILQHGFITEERKKTLLRKCSVVIVPSIWIDMFNYVVSEAFASAKPVVSFKAGGPKEQIQASGGGLLAKPFSVNSFARKIEFLLRNKGRRQNLGVKGRKWVRSALDPNEYAKFMMKLYQQL